jgi:hypothetical protein
MPDLSTAGAETELVFTIHDEAGIINSSAWLEFYRMDTRGSYLEAYNLVQVDPLDMPVTGQTKWNVDSPQDKTVRLSCRVRFPAEGIWHIQGFFYDNSKRILKVDLSIAVEKGAAMNVSGISQSKQFEDINNLLNGYPGFNGASTYVFRDSILMELELSKAPGIGEEVRVTCRIVSLHLEAANFYTHIKL